MGQYSSQEEREQFLEIAQDKIGVALKLADGFSVPCCVTRPDPCLNKATVILVTYHPNRMQWTFDPPLCESCAKAMVKLHKIKGE